MFKVSSDLILIETIYDGTVSSGLLDVHDRDKEYIGDFYGIVVALGPDYKDNLKKGDKIRFRRHEGWKVEHEGKKYLVIKKRWADVVEAA